MDVNSLRPLIKAIDQYSQPIANILSTAGVPFAGTATGIIQLLARLFHADPEDANDIANKIKSDESPEEKIKELELAIQDIKSSTDDRKSARSLASQETGFIRYLRPILILFANLTLALDLWIMYYLFSTFELTILPYILICLLCTWYLIKDIRKMTSFYFGSDN